MTNPKTNRKIFAAVAAALFVAAAASANVVIDVGTHVTGQGEGPVTIAINATGGEQISDMVGYVQIGDGGPLVGGTAGPQITSLSYAGSIWSGASGGFVSFYGSSQPAAQIIDPSVSLQAAGARVTATGKIMEITIDPAAFSPGDYAIKLVGTAGGDTQFLRAGTPVAATVANGILRILPAKEFWQQDNFGSDADNPFLEDTVWGDDADPDKDRLTNLQEYRFGTDPNIPTWHAASATGTGRPAPLMVESGGQRYPAIRLSRRISAPGATLRIQTSGDLTAWQANAIQFGTPVSLGGGNELVTFRSPTPASSQAQGFLRTAVE